MSSSSANKNVCLPIVLLISASSTAVLVELTPLLGALLGGVTTLALVAICIVIFAKVRSGKVWYSLYLF